MSQFNSAMVAVATGRCARRASAAKIRELQAALDASRGLKSFSALIGTGRIIYERDFAMSYPIHKSDPLNSLRTDAIPADPSRVDVNAEWELAYWSEKFDVLDEELKDAVREIGVVARNLERYFARKQSIRGKR
jgi:hypothetical protein